MAKYKDQHLVPRVYLKRFIEEQDNKNSEYEQGLYVSDKNFSAWKEKSVGHKTFTKPYFYTLENEDKDNPIVEKYLSLIESQYETTLKNILDKNISMKDLFFISYFTMIQHLRVEKHMKSLQNPMDKITKMLSETHGIDISEETKEIAKKILLNFGSEEESSLVFEQGVHFIENTTQENFIISDTPVVHKMLHIDELQGILKDTNIEYSGHLPNKELVLFFFPLTPKIALIATKFIALKNNVGQYMKVTNPIVITELNLLSYQNAYYRIYSTTADPFTKEVEKAIVEYSEAHKEIPYLCKIYTSKNRYNFELDKYDDSPGELKLYFTDKINVGNMVGDIFLESISIYKNRKEVRHMKEIELGRYDEALNTLEIKSKLPFLRKSN